MLMILTMAVLAAILAKPMRFAQAVASQEIEELEVKEVTATSEDVDDDQLPEEGDDDLPPPPTEEAIKKAVEKSKAKEAKRDKPEKKAKEPVEEEETETEGDEKPKPEAKEKPKEKEPAKPENKDQIDLVARAKLYNIDEKEAAEMEPAALLHLMRAIDTNLAKLGAPKPPEKKEPAAPKQEAKAPEQAKQADQTQSVREPYKLKLKKEEFDPEVVAELESMSKHYDDQLALIEAKISPLNQAEEARRKRDEEYRMVATIEAFDGVISKLGPEYEEILGKGPSLKLDPTGEHWKTRNEVAQAVQGIFNALIQANGGKPLDISDEDMVRRGLNAVAGDKLLAIERKKIANTLTKRNGAVVHRPTNRTQEISDPTKRAIQALKELRAKQGGGGPEEDEDDE